MIDKKECTLIVSINIKKLRISKGLKQKDLAILLNITERCYCYYESGKREIPLFILINLLEYYETTLNTLMNM